MKIAEIASLFMISKPFFFFLKKKKKANKGQKELKQLITKETQYETPNTNSAHLEPQ